MKTEQKLRSRIIVFCIIVALISFFAGYTIGQYTAINWAVKQATNLLKIQGYTIAIDEAVITSGLILYKNRVSNFIELKGGITDIWEQNNSSQT